MSEAESKESEEINACRSPFFYGDACWPRRTFSGPENLMLKFQTKVCWLMIRKPMQQKFEKLPSRIFRSLHEFKYDRPVFNTGHWPQNNHRSVHRYVAKQMEVSMGYGGKQTAHRLNPGGLQNFRLEYYRGKKPFGAIGIQRQKIFNGVAGLSQCGGQIIRSGRRRLISFKKGKPRKISIISRLGTLTVRRKSLRTCI